MKQFLFCLSLLISINVKATVVTGTPNPSYIMMMAGIYYGLYDFDGDGQNDFLVRILHVANYYYALEIVGKNGAMVETDGTFNAIGYNVGTFLGVNTYQDSARIHMGNFPTNSEKYVGLKFKIGQQFYCGYLGINPFDYSIGTHQIFQFGYETNSNICISAGANFSTAVEDKNFDEFNVLTANNNL